MLLQPWILYRIDSEINDVVGPYLNYAFFSFEEGDKKLENFMKDIYQRIKGMVVVTRGEEAVWFMMVRNLSIME